MKFEPVRDYALRNRSPLAEGRELKFLAVEVGFRFQVAPRGGAEIEIRGAPAAAEWTAPSPLAEGRELK